MRISRVPVPLGYLRWLALGIALFLLAIGITITANAFGLTGFAAASSDPGTKVTATVSAGAPCTADGGANERVTFTIDGREREARFNGCGHAEGEQVDITVPADPPPNLVVYAAQAATGDGTAGEGLGSVLLVAASTAGAAYTYLLRRPPRTPQP
ncbi:hypothetical protein [Actinophytocola gossypii]|uniref:Uncharacterized protein n=1 Tax=Actinophytocola gossypii TaxID=2812003 RepID=A0ABT2JHX0_9PSEU|nr:hypothetical protein [Actinophytocola gossypii]MCT2587343.1 hypothetical protein [Actinophytocola gossypii]